MGKMKVINEAGGGEGVRGGGGDKWGQGLIFLTLHDSHTNLFDVLITGLFTL